MSKSFAMKMNFREMMYDNMQREVIEYESDLNKRA